MGQTPGPSAAGRGQAEALFLSALPQIERTVRAVARRQRLSHAEAEDFGSEVHVALIENDYEILARFEGRSSLQTYLATVIQRCFIDYRRRLWGKWRPSAEAKRLGPLAQQLEALLYKTGLTLAEACETLRAKHGVAESDEAVAELARRLPVRVRRSETSLDAEESSVVATAVANDPQAQYLDRDTATRCQVLVERAMAGLSAEDRIVMRLRYEDGISVADIARMLSLEQKSLYRRIDVALARLRETLETGGLTWSSVLPMIERGQCDLRLPREPDAENRTAGPSILEGRS